MRLHVGIGAEGESVFACAHVRVFVCGWVGVHACVFVCARAFFQRDIHT